MESYEFAFVQTSIYLKYYNTLYRITMKNEVKLNRSQLEGIYLETYIEKENYYNEIV